MSEPRAKARVLLVDDDIELATLLKEYLVDEGFEVATAGDGRAALMLIETGKIDIVVLDVMMPRMNGIEFLRELRRDPELCQTVVVVLTTSADERDKLDAYGLNIAGYLVKPVTFDKFCDLVVTLNKYWTLVEFP